MPQLPVSPPTQNLNVYCDGGARGNPGPAALGFVVKDTAGRVLHAQSQFIGQATNNVAEYRAVIAALNWLSKNLSAISHKPLAISFYLDSTLVANQLSGNFKVKHPNLKALLAQAVSLTANLNRNPTFTVIPRSKNFEADTLVNKALDQRL